MKRACAALIALASTGATGSAVLAPQPSLAARQPLLSLRGGASTPSSLIAAKGAPVSEDSKQSWRGALGLIGGILIHLTCGTMYCWGNLISYIPGSLKYWGGAHGSGPADAALVLPLILVSQMLGMPLGPVLERFMGPRLTAALGALMMGSGVMLASSATALLPFVLSYSLLFGLGVGIAYQMPFITGARWFPSSKGMVTGAIISGMGAAAFLFNMLATRIVNPEGANAVGGVFPPQIYARWPGLLRTLAAVYICLSLTGAMLQSNPPSFDGKYPLIEFFKGKRVSEEQKPLRARKMLAGPPKKPLTSLIFSRTFLFMWLMILNSAVSGLNTAGSYKIFGSKQESLNSDAFLSLVGSLSAIFGNALGRFFWGSLTDKVGFKAPFITLTLLQAATMFSYKALAGSRATFTIGTVLMLFCMGGNFAMFPAQTLRHWGAEGASVYSFMFTAFGSAALLGPILGNKLLAVGGYELVYRVLGAMSFVSTALAIAL